MSHYKQLLPPSESDAVKSTSVLRRKVIWWILGAAVIALVLIIVGILATLLTLQHQDELDKRRNTADTIALADQWNAFVLDKFTESFTVAKAMRGLVLGSIETLPSVYDTPAKRIEGQYISEFDRVTRLYESNTKYIFTIFAAPGGAVSQMQPDIPSLHQLDIMNFTLPDHEVESPWETMRKGVTLIVGPLLYSFDPDKPPLWIINIRTPVYNISNIALHSVDNFWGFVYVSVDVMGILNEPLLRDARNDPDVEYLFFARDPSGHVRPILTSLPDDCPPPELERFIAQSITRLMVPGEPDWYVAVQKRYKDLGLTHQHVIITVVTVVVGSLLVFLVLFLLISWCTREYDGRRYAPKRPPFAVLTVGPCYGEELWNLVPAQMAEVTESLNRVLDRQMAAHHAYKIFQMHPYTTSYVILSVEGAVRMAFSILEELQRHPIDEPLTTLLGEDGRLLTSLAVHWCSNATVTVSLVGEDTYRYEGPDMVYGARMWIFASPNTVTISAAAQAQLSSMPGVAMEQCMAIFLRGVEGKQFLHTVTVPSNKYLADAVDIGAERMKKEYEAHRQLLAQARRESEATHNSNGASRELGASSSFSVPAAPPSPLRGVVESVSRTCSYRSSVATHHLQSVPTLTVPVTSPEVGRLGQTMASHRSSTRSGSGSSGGPRTHSLSDAGHSTSDDKPAAGRTSHVMELFDATQGTRVALREGGERAEGNALGGTMATRPSLSLTWSSANLLKLPATPIAVLAPSTANKSDDSTHANANVTAADWSSEHEAAHGREAEAAFEPVASGTHAATAALTSGAAVAAHDAHLATFDELPDRALAVHSPFRASITHAKKPPRHIAVPLNPILAATTTTTTTPPTSAALALSTAANRSGTSVSVPVEGVDSVPLRPAEAAAGGAAAGEGTLLVTVARRHTGDKHDTNGGRSSTDSLEEANCRRHANELAKPVAAMPTETPLGVDNPLQRQVSKSAVAHSSPQSTDAHSINSNALFQEFGPLTDGPMLNAAGPMEADAMLLQRAIPVWLDNGLRHAFEHHSIVFDVSYESVRVIVFCFYSSYKLLFRPLSRAERNMIFQRFVSAFGVPRKAILEHLAARCALRYLQDHENMKALTIERPSTFQAAT